MDTVSHAQLRHIQYLLWACHRRGMELPIIDEIRMELGRYE